MFNLIFGGANLIYIILLIILCLVALIFCWYKYKKTHSRQLLNCLPSVFTSLGLLGTFIAICITLSSLSYPQQIQQDGDNIGITEEEKSMAESPSDGGNEGKSYGEVYNEEQFDILALIKGLAPAFSTSILGLIFAIIATIWIKYIFAKDDAEIDAPLNNTTPEQNIFKLVELQQQLLENNRAYNEELNKSINSQSDILKRFVDDFVSRMGELFTSMQNNIEGRVNDFGEKQFEKTSEVLVSIAENLTKVSNNIINSQSQTVEQMMNKINDNINDLTKSVLESLKSLSENINASLTTMSTEQISRLTAMNTKTEDLAKTINATSTDALKDTLAMNKQTITELRTSMQGFIDDISSQCSDLKNAIESNVSLLNNAYKFIDKHIAEIRANYDQSVISYQDAVSVAHRTNETAERTIEATNNSLQSMEETNANVINVLDILNERQDSIEQLAKKINSISATIEELQKVEQMFNKIKNIIPNE